MVLMRSVLLQYVYDLGNCFGLKSSWACLETSMSYVCGPYGKSEVVLLFIFILLR